MNADTEAKQVELYQARDGSYPYENFFDGLKDRATKYKIEARITRIRRTGGLGRCIEIGDGVIEIVLDLGRGYRIYAGRVSAWIILLLCGGDTTTQWTDIAAAKLY